MAEFCLECWNRMNKTNDSEEKYVMSKYTDMCEGCGEFKSVIIKEKSKFNLFKFFKK